MAIEFAAIDFETANQFRGSPCQIGLVIVRNGEIVDEQRRLIRPPEATGPDDFDDYNIRLHGIDWEMVKGEPEFDDVWKSLSQIIGDRPIVAHNAAFDVGVLRDSLDMFGLPWPILSYTCTLVTSRRLLTLPSYTLGFVASELNIDPGQHHDALDDARAAAEIMLKLCSMTSSETLDALLGSLNVRWGKLSEGNWQGSTVKARRYRKHVQMELPEPRSDASPDHFLYGKHVVLTGALPGGIVKKTAHERIAYFGGTPQLNVTKRTNLLVVGEIEPRTLAPGAEMTGKMKKALAMTTKGQQLEIMAGFDFLPMLD